MTRLNKRAEKYTYTPGDPSASDPALREPGYAREKSFRCTYRSLSNEERVRMGVSDDNRMLRVWFYTDRVSFTRGDRVYIDDDIYEISYIPDYAFIDKIDHIDIKRIG